MHKRSSTGKASTPQRLITSPENVKKINSIVCLNLPPQLLDRVNFKRHFSKFGKVLKVSITGAKNSGTVLFDNHNSAANAKLNGALGMPPDFKIFYSQTRKSLDSTDVAPNRAANSEVEDELQSMAGGDYVAMRRGDAPLRQTNFGGSPHKRTENPFSKINAPPTFKSAAPPPRFEFFAPKPAGQPFMQQSAGNAPAPFSSHDKSKFTFVAPKRDAARADLSLVAPLVVFNVDNQRWWL